MLNVRIIVSRQSIKSQVVDIAVLLFVLATVKTHPITALTHYGTTAIFRKTVVTNFTITETSMTFF